MNEFCPVKMARATETQKKINTTKEQINKPKSNKNRNRKSAGNSCETQNNRPATRRSIRLNPSAERNEKTSKQNCDTSPSVFGGETITTYRGLKYPDNLYTGKSPDLFEPGSNEDETTNDCKTDDSGTASGAHNSIQTVSIGVQCSLSIGTQDAQVGTEGTRGTDVGTQTQPHFLSPASSVSTQSSSPWPSQNSLKIEYSFPDFDDTNCDCESSSCTDDSSDSLAGFNMLDHLNDENEVRTKEKKSYDEESVVSASPPRNQLYRNRKFYSPDSVQTNKQPSDQT